LATAPSGQEHQTTDTLTKGCPTGPTIEGTLTSRLSQCPGRQPLFGPFPAVGKWDWLTKADLLAARATAGTAGRASVTLTQAG